jgi:formylglycine-generating enzyme required for sulfatase activity
MEERQRLDSWKEIVSYLKRSEKTCRLWERKFGLPVHRIADSPKAHVFAYADEIDRWLQNKLEQQAAVGKDGILPVIGGGDGRGITASIPEALRLPEAKEYDLKTLLKIIRKPRIFIPTIAILVILGSGGYWLLNRNAKIRWAKYQAIPEIERRIGDKDLAKAFEIAQKAKRYIPEDEKLVSLLPEVEGLVSFKTNPPGADVYIKDYMRISDPWIHLGQTPIEQRRIPRGYFRYKIEKEGYDTAEGVADTSREFVFGKKRDQINADWLAKEFAVNRSMFFEALKETVSEVNWELARVGVFPQGIILLPEGKLRYSDQWFEGSMVDASISKFFIDRFEVTNKEYMEFVKQGGYKNPTFWKHAFIKNGRVISWSEAMAGFVDSTGRPGPAIWKVGHYPEGEGNFPVRGISWYEAAAYAQFAGKSLPTVSHWLYAAGLSREIWTRTYGNCPARSNFNNKGPAEAGSYSGISPFGVYDMAGNVREWCWNETGGRRYILGCSWTEQPKGFGYAETEWPLNRSTANGFRCVRYLPKGEAAPKLLEPFNLPSKPDYRNEKPCSDELFATIKTMYGYEKTELDPEIESVEEIIEGIRLERVSFNAAYGRERMIAYLCFAEGFHAPYQAVVFLPGDQVLFETTLTKQEVTLWDFIPKSGRVLVLPVLKWTLDRGANDPALLANLDGKNRSEVELTLTWYKDLARTIDYLETREDIDSTKLAYLGYSMGANNAPWLAGLEARLKTVIMVAGGFRREELATLCRSANFAPRMTRPVLMINGKYDYLVPVETAQEPLFRLFGAPGAHKRHVLMETDHSAFLQIDILIKEILDWLDKYLGPVK